MRRCERSLVFQTAEGNDGRTEHGDEGRQACEARYILEETTASAIISFGRIDIKTIRS